MRRSRRVGELLVGDMVAMEQEGIARITRAKPAPGRFAIPHRKDAPRTPVPAWTVCWTQGKTLGQAYLDPDDRVYLA